jgi:hypothetical protein
VLLIFLEELRREIQQVTRFTRRTGTVEIIEAKIAIDGQDPVTDRMHLLDQSLSLGIERERDHRSNLR